MKVQVSSQTEVVVSAVRGGLSSLPSDILINHILVTDINV